MQQCRLQQQKAQKSSSPRKLGWKWKYLPSHIVGGAAEKLSLAEFHSMNVQMITKKTRQPYIELNIVNTAKHTALPMLSIIWNYSKHYCWQDGMSENIEKWVEWQQMLVKYVNGLSLKYSDFQVESLEVCGNKDEKVVEVLLIFVSSTFKFSKWSV